MLVTSTASRVAQVDHRAQPGAGNGAVAIDALFKLPGAGAEWDQSWEFAPFAFAPPGERL